MRKTHFGMMLVGVFVGMVVGAGLVVLQMKYGKGPDCAAGGGGSCVSYMDEPKPLAVDTGKPCILTLPPQVETKPPEDVKAAPCARQAEPKPAPEEMPCPTKDTSIWIGKLRPAGFSIDGKPGFVLEDSEQRVLLYTTGESKLDMTPLVGQEVVLTGWAGHREDLRGEYLVARKAVSADSDPEPTTTTVAAAPPTTSVIAPPPAADLPASREEVYQRLFKFMMDHSAAGKAVEKQPETSVEEPATVATTKPATDEPAPVPDAIPEKVAPSMEWRKSWGNEATTASRPASQGAEHIPAPCEAPPMRELAQQPNEEGVGPVEPILPEPMAPSAPVKRKVRSWPAIGTFACEMCPENHLTLPEEVSGISNTLYIGPGPEECLCIYSATQLKRVVALGDQEQITPELRRHYHRALFSELEKITPNPDGTIEITDKLREYAGLKEKALVIGAGDHYEIWDTVRWAKYCEEDEEDDATESPEKQEAPPNIASAAPAASSCWWGINVDLKLKELAINGCNEARLPCEAPKSLVDECEQNCLREASHCNPSRILRGTE